MLSAVRDRFVIYKSGTQWDGSQVPPEWHVWMHRFKDSNPVTVRFAPQCTVRSLAYAHSRSLRACWPMRACMSLFRGSVMSSSNARAVGQ